MTNTSDAGGASRLRAWLGRRVVWYHPALRWADRLSFSAAMLLVALGSVDRGPFWSAWHTAGFALIAASFAIQAVNGILVRGSRDDGD